MCIPFPGHSTAFEVDADYIEGTNACTCPMCRPHRPTLSFMSRDNLGLSGGRPAHRFSRQRLNHQFTAVKAADAAWMQAPRVERLKLKQKNHP